MKIITPQREFHLSTEYLTNYLYPSEAYILMDYDLNRIPVIYEDDFGYQYEVIIKNVTGIFNLVTENWKYEYEFDLEFINGYNNWVETGF